MKQKIVGSYFAGYESVELVLREGNGGDVFFLEKGKIAVIKIGADTEWLPCFIALSMKYMNLY